MSILGVLWRNLTARARTRTAADIVPTPAGFRGMIEHDPSLCTGCTACMQVCAPRAISFDTTDATSITWKFFAGQCSYCGLCVQYCPTQAITNPGKLPPVTGDQSLHRVAHKVDYRPCADCGRPILPLPETLLHGLYPGAVTQSVREQQALCESCRRKQTSKGIRDAFLGAAPEQEKATT
ncbi:MAG TPA: 4Fe-4S dicluster domain-containing protein [Burkholderiales bacterium]|nr:4Fe-4S dicluster domain-containing protein [Burkholderiales bacterium]